LLCGGVAAEMVLTPFGERPAECVIEVADDAVITETTTGLQVTENGIIRNFQVPQVCNEDNIAERYRMAKLQAGKPAAIINGWLDNAGWYPPTAQSQLDSFTATYTVPQDPAVSRTNVLFYFIGMQDNAAPRDEVNIIQPVLTWGNGIAGWNAASWACCPKNITTRSPSLRGIRAGDTVSGIIKRLDPFTWSIDTRWNGQNTTLRAQVGGYNYNWADVTLEVYNIDTTMCGMFGNGPMKFSNLVLKDVQGEVLSPKYTLTGPTACNGRLQIAANSDITITHN